MPTATIHTTTTTYTAAHTQKLNVFEIHIAKIKLYMMKSEKKQIVVGEMIGILLQAWCFKRFDVLTIQLSDIEQGFYLLT